MKITVAWASVQGPRKEQQDRVVVDDRGPSEALVVLCDGMGGHNAGDVAAETAAGTIYSRQPRTPDALLQAIHAAQLAVRAESRKPRQFNCGTTCSTVLVTGGSAHFVHAGDSRIALVRGGKLSWLTWDQTIGGYLAHIGHIKPEDQKEYNDGLIGFVGTVDTFEPEAGTVNLRRGDVILLMSDGVHGVLSDTEIARDSTGSARDICNRIIEHCRVLHFRDNTTIAAITVA